MNTRSQSWWKLALAGLVLGATLWAIRTSTQEAKRDIAPEPKRDIAPEPKREHLAKVLLDLTAPSESRIQAARDLGDLEDPLSLDPLLQVLDTRNLELREAAIESLRVRGAGRTLLSRLADPKQPASVRKAAAQGLGFLQDSSAIPVLVAALKDPSAEVRAEAALTLSALGPETAQEALIAALKDPSAEVRYFAASALGSVRTPQAEAALIACKSVEQDQTVQSALAVALDRLSRPPEDLESEEP